MSAPPHPEPVEFRQEVPDAGSLDEQIDVEIVALVIGDKLAELEAAAPEPWTSEHRAWVERRLLLRSGCGARDLLHRHRRQAFHQFRDMGAFDTYTIDISDREP